MSNNAERLVLLNDVLSVLYRNNSIWALCGGAQKRVGMSPESLLESLGSGWDASTLNSVLRYGKQIGALRQQMQGNGTCPTDVIPTLNYFINWNMLFENNINRVFLTVIPSLPQPHLHRQMPFVIY